MEWACKHYLRRRVVGAVVMRPAGTFIVLGVGLGLHTACASDSSRLEGGADAEVDGSVDAPIDASAEHVHPHWDSGATCELASEGLVDFVHANKACIADADCSLVEGCVAWPHEECTGGFYLNTAHDPVAWSSRVAAIDTCVGALKCGVGCGLIPPPPYCWRNQCWGSTYSMAEREECLGAHGGPSPCAICVCGSCKSNSCTSDEGCAKLFACAQKAGCLGTEDCDPNSPSFPCTQIFSQGVARGSTAAQHFAQLNACASWGGCAKVCKP